jgi:hypothetical protein
VTALAFAERLVEKPTVRVASRKALRAYKKGAASRRAEKVSLTLETIEGAPGKTRLKLKENLFLRINCIGASAIALKLISQMSWEVLIIPIIFIFISSRIFLI